MVNNKEKCARLIIDILKKYNLANKEEKILIIESINMNIEDEILQSSILSLMKLDTQSLNETIEKMELSIDMLR